MEGVTNTYGAASYLEQESNLTNIRGGKDILCSNPSSLMVRGGRKRALSGSWGYLGATPAQRCTDGASVAERRTPLILDESDTLDETIENVVEWTTLNGLCWNVAGIPICDISNFVNQVSREVDWQVLLLQEFAYAKGEHT